MNHPGDVSKAMPIEGRAVPVARDRVTSSLG